MRLHAYVSIWRYIPPTTSVGPCLCANSRLYSSQEMINIKVSFGEVAQGREGSSSRKRTSREEKVVAVVPVVDLPGADAAWVI